MNLKSCLNDLRKASAFIRYKDKKIIGSGVGFEEFIIQKCFQRLEPTEKKPQGHFEGNTPVEFEGVVISMI